jgi:hypothetical protein
MALHVPDWSCCPTHTGTNLCIGAEEYAPSVFIFNCDFANPSACGTMVVRYVPKGSPYKDGNGIKVGHCNAVQQEAR